MENIVQKIMQPKWRKTKNEVTKVCDEPGSRSELSKNRKKSADVLMDTPITLFHGAEQV